MPELTIEEFISKHQRLPMANLGEEPWLYRGILRQYVIAAHMSPKVDFPNRWGYLAETILRGEFLDDPIPQVEFLKPADRGVQQVQDEIRLYIDLMRDKRIYKFVEWLAWALGVNDPNDDFISADEKETLYRKVNLLTWLQYPADHLGIVYSRSLRGRAKYVNGNAFFPTPQSVTDCMAAMLQHDVKKTMNETRHLSVNDPCVGSGRFLLTASNFSMNLSGQDIDRTAIAITMINGVLFAPWMIKKPQAAIEKARNNAATKQGKDDPGSAQGVEGVVSCSTNGVGVKHSDSNDRQGRLFAGFE